MYEDGRYRLYDKTGKTIAAVGQYPYRGKDMPSQDRFFLYQGILCSSPDGRSYAMGTSYCDNLEFYQIKNVGATLVKKYETYDVSGSFNQTVKLNDDCVMAYKGAYGTERYCYMLYSGERFSEQHKRVTGGKKIRVFDWNGTYIRTFEADKTVFSFCVDDSDNALYAITHDDEAGFELARFDLQ